MATSAKVKRAAQRYKGKYKGREIFKGNKKKQAAWKKAGSPKNVELFLKKYNARPKIYAAGNYKGKYPGKDKFKGNQKKLDAHRASKSKTKTPSKDASPSKAPANKANTAPKVPVSDSTGKLISPANWQADQARLASLAEDNAELQSIYTAEDSAESQYLNDQQSAKSTRDQRALGARRQRDELNRTKASGMAGVKTRASYRGMGRSTAFNRGVSNLNTEVGKVDQAIGDEEASATKDWSETMRNAALRKTSTFNSLAPRKKYLADRASRKGVYTK